MVLNNIINVFLLLSVFALRHVQEEFAMNFEVKWVTAAWYISGFIFFLTTLCYPDSPFVTGEYVQYLFIIRGLICLVVTGILPIKQTYSPNSIIPFPINEECIKTLEMALLLPTSANFFYDYLENYCLDKDALLYFGMYADLRTYIRMCEERSDEYVLNR